MNNSTVKISSVGSADKFNIAPGQLFIDGRWRDAQDGKSAPCIYPATEEQVTTIAQGTEADLNAAVGAARRAFGEGKWSRISGFERGRVLNLIADLIDENLEDLSARQVLEMGKTIKQSKFEIEFTANLFRYHAGWAGKIDGSVKDVSTGKFHCYTVYEPLGVVAAITPFNVPIYLAATKMAPALAAGNSFIHKPASNTSLSAIKMAQIMEEAGLPPGVFNLITGPGDSLGKAISRHPGIDKIAFTGSTEIGIDIIKESAATLKKVTMELGGKSPNIVLADADVDLAAQNALTGNFLNSGQICTSGSRLIVERPIYDEVLEKLTSLLDNSPVGDPFDEQTYFGPLASANQLEKYETYLAAGKKDGAKLSYGGGRVDPSGDGKGFFVQPVVFSEADNQMRIAREEIFAPILTVIPVENFYEALKVANETSYGLASAIQTKDINKAFRAAQAIRAGTVWINTEYAWDNGAPFGGSKMSGYGRENGREAFENYMQTKTVWFGLDG